MVFEQGAFIALMALMLSAIVALVRLNNTITTQLTTSTVNIVNIQGDIEEIKDTMKEQNNKLSSTTLRIHKRLDDQEKKIAELRSEINLIKNFISNMKVEG